MYKLNRIKITGLRRLSAIDLEARPFMVLIGANGVGKTTFLDAFSLLSASASGLLNTTLSKWGGITSLLTRGKSNEASFAVNMTVPGHDPLQYELHITSQGSGYSISKEVLSQNRGQTQPFTHIDSAYNDIRYFETDGGRLVRPDWEHNPLETSLTQVPKMFRQPEELRRILATVTRYHALDVGPRAPVKLPQPMKPAILPGADGKTWCLISIVLARLSETVLKPSPIL